MIIISYLTEFFMTRRFAFLFFSLLLTMMAAPIFGTAGLRTSYLEVVLALTILAAFIITLFSLGMSIGMGFLGLILATRVGYFLLGYEPLLATSQGIGAAICIVSACIMLRFILSEGYVTSERIFAALGVHILIGITCGLLFCILENGWSGSFSAQGSPLTERYQDPLAHTIYFSFVTLGTLGYGDIIPVSGPARALAVTESIIGQMYLVVVVARLVSLYKIGTDCNEPEQTEVTAQARNISRS
jgi:hypothetical protein